MYCKKCGAEVREIDRFCRKCGNELAHLVEMDDGLAMMVYEGSEFEDSEEEQEPSSTTVQSQEVSQLINIQQYTGEDKVFPFLGTELQVPAELDSFMHYRKCFKYNARIQADTVKQQVCSQIYCLDHFFDLFPDMYLNNLAPLITNAFGIILSYGIYDITGEDFSKQHMADFCSADNTYKTMQEAVNNTLINNENAIHNRYSSIPNIGFIGGLGTVLAVEAANIAISSSYKSSLKNVRLTQPQKIELYNRINFDALMNQVYQDYWNVAFSLCFRLHNHDCGVWYPTVEGNTRAEGLMKNLNSGLVPESQRINVIHQVFKSRPIEGSLFGYLRRNYPGDPEIEEICKYFGY